MNLIIEKSTDPYHNLAREEILLSAVREDTIYLWRNRPSVIVGRHQNTLAEIDEEAAKKEKIKIVRRLTGGGAVFHDLGNINFSYIFAGGDFDEKKNRGLELMLSFLRSCGARCYATGRNDICMRDSAGREVKVSGTAMTQRGERGIFHGCVLFDCDLSRLERVLTPRREKLTSKGIASVRSRVSNLREMVPALGETEADAFFAAWCEALTEECRLIEAQDLGEAEAAQELMETKYRSRDWNFGRNPVCTVENSRTFPVGTVEFHAEVKGGVITSCCFTGDYLTERDFREIASLLCRSPFTDDGMEKALGEIDTKSFFGTDNLGEILRFLAGRSV